MEPSPTFLYTHLHLRIKAATPSPRLGHQPLSWAACLQPWPSTNLFTTQAKWSYKNINKVMVLLCLKPLGDSSFLLRSCTKSLCSFQLSGFAWDFQPQRASPQSLPHSLLEVQLYWTSSVLRPCTVYSLSLKKLFPVLYPLPWKKIKASLLLLCPVLPSKKKKKNFQVIQYICKFLLHHLIYPQPFIGEETELKLTTQNPNSSKRLSWDVNACLTSDTVVFPASSVAMMLFEVKNNSRQIRLGVGILWRLKLI